MPHFKTPEEADAWFSEVSVMDANFLRSVRRAALCKVGGLRKQPVADPQRPSGMPQLKPRTDEHDRAQKVRC